MERQGRKSPRNRAGGGSRLILSQGPSAGDPADVRTFSLRCPSRPRDQPPPARWTSHPFNTGARVCGRRAGGVKHLPRQISHALGVAGTWLACMDAQATRRGARRQFPRRLPRAERRRQRDALALRAYRSYARRCDRISCAAWTDRGRGARALRGPEAARRAASRSQLRLGKGVILVTGHFGNWEIGGVMMRAPNLPLTIVAMREASAEHQSPACRVPGAHRRRDARGAAVDRHGAAAPPPPRRQPHRRDADGSARRPRPRGRHVLRSARLLPAHAAAARLSDRRAAAALLDRAAAERAASASGPASRFTSRARWIATTAVALAAQAFATSSRPASARRRSAGISSTTTGRPRTPSSIRTRPSTRASPRDGQPAARWRRAFPR